MNLHETATATAADIGRVVYIVQCPHYVCDVISDGPGGRARLVCVSQDEDAWGRKMGTIAAHMVASNGHTVNHWASDDPAVKSLSPAEAESLLSEARRAHERRKVHEKRQQEAREQAVLEWQARLDAIRPSWATACIVAQRVVDESDTMTDYFATRTAEEIVLAWSKHNRNLFSEMRKAATLSAHTQHLSDGPKSVEHREAWSMGDGYYLKDGLRYSDGWRVCKTRSPRPLADLSIVEQLDAQRDEPRAIDAGSAYTIEKHYHTKRECDIWAVVLADRVDRDEFVRLRNSVKDKGGWYSRKWRDFPGGFCFLSEQTATAWASNALDGPDGQPQQAETNASPDAAERLRVLADRMYSEIAAGRADRRANTPRQRKQATMARYGADHAERAQAILRAVADATEGGALPEDLRAVKVTKKLARCAAQKHTASGLGYYEYRESDQWTDNGAQAQALRRLANLDTEDPAKLKERVLRDRLATVANLTIDGFFPTPPDVCRAILDLADIQPGMSVLEPSAGAGDMADAIHEATGIRPTCCEIQPRLSEILTLKGYEVAATDFTGHGPDTLGRFDRIAMNPPFERGQDMDHVQHAHALLTPGGRIVSVMSPGPFFRSDRKAEAFRAWFSGLGGEKYDLPDGSFKTSGTSVSACLIVLDA